VSLSEQNNEEFKKRVAIAAANAFSDTGGFSILALASVEILVYSLFSSKEVDS